MPARRCVGCQTSWRGLSCGHGSPGAVLVVDHVTRLAGLILDLTARTCVVWEATVMDLAAYLLEPLRQDGEFILYRGQPRRQTERVLPPVLVMAPVSEHPALGSLRRLEHEYTLRAELDPAWAVRPLALAQHQGRTMLVLEHPGGEPLD